MENKGFIAAIKNLIDPGGHSHKKPAENKDIDKNKDISAETEEEFADDLPGKYKRVNENIELLSKQVTKNSYIKTIENNLREIEEAVNRKDNPGVSVTSFEELKKKYNIGMEKQRALRKNTRELIKSNQMENEGMDLKAPVREIPEKERMNLTMHM